MPKTFSLPPLRIKVTRADGETVFVQDIPDPRAQICELFNQRETELKAEPLMENLSDLSSN